MEPSALPMPLILTLTSPAIDALDLTPGHELIKQLLENPKAAAQQVQCHIDYPRGVDDPRELSEIPEVRLWFVRFDATYPWMPYFLDWRGGELARYAAMLVPHRFNPREGIEFNSEALELFLYSKIFVLLGWLKQKGLGSVSDLKHMALVFGFEVNDEFLQLWDREDWRGVSS